MGKVPPLRQDFAGQAKYEAIKIGIAPQKKITHPNPSLILREGQEGKKYILDEDELKKRINKRIEKWFRMGLLKEVSNLHKNGLSWKRMSEIGLEYKLVAEHLKFQSHSAKAPRDKQKLLEKMAEKTWQYAKRQMTWFKKDKNIIWIEPKFSLIEKEIKKFICG